MPASDGPRPHGEIAHKVLNNNVVVTIDSRGRERVLMGRGIGFQLAASDLVDISKVEKTFTLDRETDGLLVEEVLASTPYDVVEAVAEGMEEAERSLGRDLGRSVAVAIMDHIRFVLERLADGVRIASAPMPELGVLYPDEFRAAEALSRSIGARLGVAMPPEETVFLATHLLNATRDEPNGSAALLFRRVQHVVSIVEAKYGITLNQGEPDYARFILHVKFLLQRLVTRSMLRNDDTSFYEYATQRYPRAFESAQAVTAYVQASTDAVLTKEEVLYLIVHIERVTNPASGVVD